MRITNLTDPHTEAHTCNVYLVQGDWKAVENIATLIDVGNDPAIIDRIRAVRPGIGPEVIRQVILTHSHSDHTGLLPAIRRAFTPMVYAHPLVTEADRSLLSGQLLRCGDREFQVVYTPGHSEDSISLYSPDEEILFTGDSLILSQAISRVRRKTMARWLQRLCRMPANTIYPGHGQPLRDSCNVRLRSTLTVVQNESHPEF